MTNLSKQKIILFLALFVISLFSGCAKSKMKRLSETINKYNKTLKWGAYSASSLMMTEDSRKELTQRILKELNNKNIVDYAIADMSYDEESKTATAIVQYSYINQRTQSLHNFAEIQLWSLTKGSWRLSNILESRKAKGTHLD